MKRFVNELLPRDLLAEEIYKQMAKDGTDHVWEDLRTIPREELMEHFPNIVEHCREMGYDVNQRMHSCGTGTALFHGWGMGRSRKPYVHGTSVCCGRDGM